MVSKRHAAAYALLTWPQRGKAGCNGDSTDARNDAIRGPNGPDTLALQLGPRARAAPVTCARRSGARRPDGLGAARSRKEQAGFAHHPTKPVDVDAVAALLEQHLAQLA